ncbi:tRNA (adenosine(37)-N6)-threonylcarbamoyltransferase complex ATPase subunit type 1 TsaE [Candidatus Saccharibacteria bacterium]|nr:tRNA (adenosine(37)-N6)-threonylcarbamoyltransferase complex ATPase subunit type 1 TsaE [Candidatus Saccharibacteria bacterium]
MLDFGREFADYIAGRVTTFQGDPQTSGFGGKKSRQDPSGEITTGPAGATIVELIGDVGAGKTTFVRGLAEGLGATTPVTSPSFTISKSYPLPNNRNLVHYDFYRLPDVGLMAEDLSESLSDPNNIVVVEWGASVNNLLPDHRIVINIQYDDTGNRDILVN